MGPGREEVMEKPSRELAFSPLAEGITPALEQNTASRKLGGPVEFI